MHWLPLIYILITGFTACAEFGSFVFVHPVLRKLPPEFQIQAEQGLVTTFGTFMPIGMTASVIIGITHAIHLWGTHDTAQWLSFIAALCFVIGLIATLLLNVPRNFSVTRWDPKHLPTNWKQQRIIWDRAQGLRATLFLVAFVLLTASIFAAPGQI